MPRRRPPTATCPHCGRELLEHKLQSHDAVCPMRPDIADAMRKTLTGADGYAITRTEYEAIAFDAGLPSRSLLCKMVGDWPAVCALYGVPMRPAPVKVEPPKRVETPQEKPPRKRHNRRDDAQIDAEIGAEIDEAREIAQRAQALARWETDHGYTVAVRRSDGTPYVRTLPGGGVACMLR